MLTLTPLELDQDDREADDNDAYNKVRREDRMAQALADVSNKVSLVVRPELIILVESFKFF